MENNKVENTERDKIIKRILRYIDWNFTEIRSAIAVGVDDYRTDPRWNCREGWEAVSRLKEVLGIPGRPYRHGTDSSLEVWLESIERRMNEIK